MTKIKELLSAMASLIGALAELVRALKSCLLYHTSGDIISTEGGRMWTIEFHDKAKEEFDDCPWTVRKGFYKIFNRIVSGGLSSLSAKHSKPIGEGLFELRATGKDVIARSLYITREGQVVKILAVFIKKTEKTPQDKIELAKKRKDE